MKKRNTKLYWILGIFAVALSLFGLARLYYRLTDDFRFSNMTYEMPYYQDWEIEPLDAKQKNHLDIILNQPYTYLGKGAQSYAFVSQDERYILKFFKFKHLKPALFVDLLPPIPPFANYKATQTSRKNKKLRAVFAGYKLAYDKNKEESGLLFIHLNKTNTLHKSVTVTDKIGLKHTIDLDPVVFVIQEKGKTLRNVLSDLLKDDQVAIAKEKVSQIFNLYYSEYQKGFFDHDHGVLHNTGFIDNRPFHLDVGKLTRDEEIKIPENHSLDLAKVAVKINSWLKHNFPKQQPQLASAMEQHLSELLDSPFYFKDYPTSFPKKKKRSLFSSNESAQVNS